MVKRCKNDQGRDPHRVGFSLLSCLGPLARLFDAGDLKTAKFVFFSRYSCALRHLVFFGFKGIYH